MADRVDVRILVDEGDERGRAWQLGDAVELLSGVEDVHLMTLDRGHVRGNHFHRDKREILVVDHDGPWALYWDDGAEAERQERRFAGTGMVAILIPPNCAHAIENLGPTMRIVAISDRPYDPDSPDAPRRILRPIG